MESQAEVIPTTQENNNNGDTTINNLPSSNPSSLPFYQISKRYTLAILSHIGLILTISIFSYYHKIGATFPSFYSIWRYWAPPLERSTLLAIGCTGLVSNWVIFNFIATRGYQGISTDFISTGPLKLQNILYFYGILGILWYFAWHWHAFEHPSQHPRIIQQELTYLQQNITIKHETPMPSITWKKILINMPILTLILVNFSHNLTHPQSLKIDLYNYNFYMNFYSLNKLIIILVTSYVADLLLRKTSISTTNLRKIYISGGLTLSVLVILFVPNFMWDPSTGHIIAWYVELIIYCLPYVALFANHLDIAGQYAGITIALTNMIIEVYSMLKDDFKIEIFEIEIIDSHTFNKFLYIVLFLVGALLYCIFGTSEQQDLDNEKKQEESTISRL
ncbi:vesicular glutamate transporter 2-like isoform X3 [Chrysoperla carnea]|uniref:vesicular glutamate transporter 2-like isoform X3 n=1 Tax=Chrysoperla carnea TaxID=189513 RepID=UPI001D0955A3|nr:vesicular glutamate transporter 2-like isoform X3 [Chrysoperla carnea]